LKVKKEGGNVILTGRYARKKSMTRDKKIGKKKRMAALEIGPTREVKMLKKLVKLPRR